MKRSAVTYEIRIEGYLNKRWSAWFGGMSLTHEDAPRGDTILTVTVPDQAALHGVLIKVRDLGLTLISVVRIQPERNEIDAPTGDRAK